MRFKIIQEIEIDISDDITLEQVVKFMQESDRQDLKYVHEFEEEGSIINYYVCKVNTQVIKL